MKKKKKKKKKSLPQFHPPDGAALDALHEVSDKAGNLVAERLGGDDSDLVNHSLVGVEVQRKTRVVLLDDDPGGLLDRLGANATLQSVNRQRLGGVVSR